MKLKTRGEIIPKEDWKWEGEGCIYASTYGELRRKIHGEMLGPSNTSVIEYCRSFPEARSWKEGVKVSKNVTNTVMGWL